MKDEIIIRWVKKAESDLKVVKHMLEVDEPPTDALCFHCQQAIGKYLKAFLTFKDVRVEKIHDMESLLNLCIEQDKDFENLEREKISRLSFFAVEIRYPDEFYVPAVSETKEYFAVALKVKDFVLKKLKVKESEITGR